MPPALTISSDAAFIMSGSTPSPGQSHDAVFRGGLDEDGVILLILVLRAVVQIDGAEGSGEDRRGEAMTEQLKGDVGIGEVLAERVHVDVYLLPLVIVARRGVAGELAAGAGHGVAAGAAVADGTCLAVGAYALSCGAENFVVIHGCTSSFFACLVLLNYPPFSREGQLR